VDKQKIIEAIKKAKEGKKRNFKQSIDFSIVLKDVNLDSPEERIEEFFVLPKGLNKKKKICALVDKELLTQAKEVFDKVIAKDDFSKYAGNKRKLKKLARAYDYFVAQATIMTDVASTFGKAFGPKGKMPNPKAGCIVPPKADLKSLNERLQKTVRIKAKKQPVISVMVGTEDMPEEDVAENINAVYEFVKRKLPRGDQQIKKAYVKLTMGKPVLIGA